MYDVAIVGAGPAGATLARLIAGTHKVLLVEKRDPKGLSHGSASGKCCGGLLAPDAQKMLSIMGLGLPQSVLEEPQLFVVRTIDIPQRIERYYQRHYINLDRQRFDQWLFSMIPSQVDIRTHCRFESYSSEDGFKLVLSQEGKTYAEKARILVGADGATSKVRILSSPGYPAPQQYFAIQEWVEGDSALPYFTALFDPEITDHYGWTIPKAGYLVIGAALPPGKGAPERFRLFRNKLKDYGFHWGKSVRREGAFLLRPLRINQLLPGRKGIAFIGEAAGWISPSSGEGLSYAFRSALMLAESLHAMPNGFEGLYDKKTRLLKRNILLKNLKSSLIFHPFLRKALMKSGIRSIELYGPSKGGLSSR